MVQILIFIFSITAMFLISTKTKYSKWGYLIGLLSQPFWFISSIKNETWGIFAVSCIYTITWGLGIYNYIYKSYGGEE